MGSSKMKSKNRRWLPTLGELIDRLIWYNESQVRKGEKGSDNLMLTHGLNGIRNTAVNKIMEVVGGRKDYKVDCIASEFKDWEVSWDVSRDKK